MRILRRAWAKYQQLLITHPWKTQTIGTGIVINEIPFLIFFLRGGHKGGKNTAIPHMVAREYRNTASKFSQIPKPRLQMVKVDVVNTTNPPFK